MKKLIAILFILVMCIPLLPSVVSITQDQQNILLSIAEEEHTKDFKDKKVVKENLTTNPFDVDPVSVTTSYPYTHSPLSEEPYLSSVAPPPDAC